MSDLDVARILQSARAMIVPAIEEFGIASVESQAAGRPVIARGGGGALETVIGGVTGRFFSGGPEELAQAVLEFDDAAVSPEACIRNAARFATNRFKAGILAEVAAALAMGRRPVPNRQPLASTRLITKAAGATGGRRTYAPRKNGQSAETTIMLPPEVDPRPDGQGVVAGA